MDGEAVLGAEDVVGLNGLLRCHVNGTHEPLRLVRSDGEQREADVGKALVESREGAAETGVAGEIDVAMRGFQEPSTPQRAIAIEGRAGGKVLRLDAVQAYLAPGV